MLEVLHRAALKEMFTSGSKAVHAMVEGVKHAARHAPSTQVGHDACLHVSAGISTTTGTTIAHQLGPAILTIIALHTQAIVTRVLSSAEFHAGIHAAAENCVYITLRTVFLHATTVDMVPPLALFYADKLLSAVPSWNTISQVAGGLANKISEMVEVAINKEFRVMNRTNMDRVASEIFKTDKLPSAVADEISRSGSVEEVMKRFGGNPRSTYLTRSRL